MAELKMGEFGVSKYGEAIYIAGSVLHPPNLAWTVLTAGYLQYSEGTLSFMRRIDKRIWSRLAKLCVSLYKIGATTRFLLSEHFDIGAAYAQYGSL